MEKIRIERVSQYEPVLELNIPVKEIISVHNSNGEMSFGSNYLVSTNKELVSFLQLLLNAKGFSAFINRGDYGFQINAPKGYVFSTAITDEKDRIAIVLSKNLGVSYAIK